MKRLHPCCLLAALLALAAAPGALAQYVARIAYECDGAAHELVAHLDYSNAPVACGTFIRLANGGQPWLDANGAIVSDRPWYPGAEFSRIIYTLDASNAVCPIGIVGGNHLDDAGNAIGPGFYVRDESDNGRSHAPATLSLLQSGPDLSAAEFLVSFSNNAAYYDGADTVFADIVSGLADLQAIAAAATNNAALPSPVVITSVTLDPLDDAARAFSPEAACAPLPRLERNGVRFDSITASSAQLHVRGQSNAQNHVFFTDDLLGDWLHADYWASSEASSADWLSTLDIGSAGFLSSAAIAYPDFSALPLDAPGDLLVLADLGLEGVYEFHFDLTSFTNSYFFPVTNAANATRIVNGYPVVGIVGPHTVRLLFWSATGLFANQWDMLISTSSTPDFDIQAPATQRTYINGTYSCGDAIVLRVPAAASTASRSIAAPSPRQLPPLPDPATPSTPARPLPTNH